MNNQSTIFVSKNKSLTDELIGFQNAEYAILVQEYVDTMSPSIESMKASEIIVEMMLELGEHINSKGKSEKAKKASKRLITLFNHITNLNSLTVNLFTLKKANESIITELRKVKKENSELKQQLENIKQA